ncbi:lysine-sensitive aspartokinase 3 [Spirochaetia bacterium 38H-sp]|uniref:Aspartokinase n=1 Tax=Rarispira pelagica TaxID=3141764 RepID=A0ABU9UDT5_9SPIR
MVVLKFGGTSVQNAERMDAVLSIVENNLKNRAVLVSSATAKTTDRLIQAARAAARGDDENYQSILNVIITHHYEIAHAFLSKDYLDKATDTLQKLFSELADILKSLCEERHMSKKDLDYIQSFGERMSTFLLYYRALERGMDAFLADSREYIKTDDNYGAAQVDYQTTERLLSSFIKKNNNKLIIMQGFIASAVDGTTTTLGRGGSDFSAAIIGAAIGADEIQIWTDVHGIMSADPRVVDNPRPIPAMSYQEAAELAYFGAKVVHPSTIQPAVEKGIPVLVKNTMAPEKPGTTITSKSPSKGLKAITGKKHISLINIRSYRMLNAYGFLNKIFSVFAEHKTPVDLIATSEVSVSLTIDDNSNLGAITKELSRIAKVDVEEDKSIVSLIGEDVWKSHETIIKTFSALKGIDVRMITMGSSHINLSFVVHKDKADEAVRRLHKTFFLDR